MKTHQTSDKLEDQVLEALVKVLGPGPVKLHEPTFDGNEWNYLKECLDSTYVSSVGKFVDKFESNIVNFTGAKYAISVVNGTAGLHIALKLSGVKDDDEVLVPALTFVATANAVTYCNAVPHFVDSEESTLGMDVEKLREYLRNTTEQKSGLCINISTGRVIRAMVPMHTFGHPSNIEGLLSISKDFNIVLVEDAAESIGSYYFGQHTGTFGLFGVISFNGNKTITTGGGGAILTNDASLARHAKHITTTARIPHSWEFIHDEIGYNYRMPNINAALGCAQMEQLSNKLEAKRKLFDAYDKVFKNSEFLQLVEEPANCKSNYWLQTIKLNNPSITLRDKILDVTNTAGYMTRPTWALLCDLDQFKCSPKSDLTISKELFSSLINIPSSHNLLSLNLMP
jgi:aminotransferase in exopolysaccharide biosynthesis